MMRLAPETQTRSLFDRPAKVFEALSEALPDIALSLRTPMARDNGPTVTADAFTIGLSRDAVLAKHFRRDDDGLWCKGLVPPRACNWTFAEAFVPDFPHLAKLVFVLSAIDRVCLIRAAVHPDQSLNRAQLRRWHASCRAKADGRSGPLIDVPRHWLIVDIDDVGLPCGYGYDDADAMLAWLLGEVLPPPFQNRTCVWQFSGSAGLTTSRDASSADRRVKVHLFFRAQQPIGCRDFHALLKAGKFHMIDRACAVGPQPIYTAKPRLKGGSDPLKDRLGIYYGTSDLVDLTNELQDLAATPARTAHKTTPATKSKCAQRAASQTPRQSRAKPQRGVTPYDHAWLRILYNDMGSHADGYRHPIYCMVSAAIRNGERDFENLKAALRFDVEHRLNDLGDAHKRGDVEKYLSDGELNEAICNALAYWTGE